VVCAVLARCDARATKTAAPKPPLKATRVILARCDARATKTAAPKPPLKATRVNRSVNRVAVSRKVNGLRKDNKVNKGNKGNESTKGSMPVLDSKTVNIRVVTSHRNLARGRPSVAG